MLIGITGKARSGKDTVASHLVNTASFTTLSFAEPIKKACGAMFGWGYDHLHGRLKETVDSELGFSPREAMQKLGTEWGRQTMSETIWLDIAKKSINWRLRNQINVVVTDVRFNNEADLIRELGGSVVHIHRDDAQTSVVHIHRDDAQTVNAHASENGVEHKLSDYSINNSGSLPDLYHNVDKLIVDMVKHVETN